MRFKSFILIALLIFGLMGCGRHRIDSDATEKDRSDRHSAAFRAGEVAHDLSKEVGKAAKTAGREVGKDADEAREGWSQAQRNDRQKKKAKK